MSTMDIKGLVSIGIPTYNRPICLERILRVATSQTYRNLEIIISDNASTDESVEEVIEKYLKIDNRIIYFKQPKNTGVLANADFVLKQSRGEYFTWFSDDDWRSPEFVDILVEALESDSNIGSAFCDYHEVDENGKQAEGYPNSHANIFRPFESKHRLVRTLSFYWQNAAKGKSNIFYAVHRKSWLNKIELEKISERYSRLNMDELIVFRLLQENPTKINEEFMCTLTCGNTKYYKNRNIENEQNRLSKLVDIFKSHYAEKKLYKSNTHLPLERIAIELISPIKLVSHIASIAAMVINRSVTRYLTITSSERDSQPKPLNKIELPNITLVAMATRNVEQTVKALNYSCRGINFGAVKLLSHYTPNGLPENIEHIRISKISDIDEWSRRAVYDLGKFIDTEFALLVHADGFIVNPSSWNDEFLNYDYIGAPWPLPSDGYSYRDTDGNIIRVGNSVSIRSKKLLDLPTKIDLAWEPYFGHYNEDGFICVKNRHIYKEHGIKYAPLDLAIHFSHECMIPELKGIKPFAFHKWAGTNKFFPKF